MISSIATEYSKMWTKLLVVFCGVSFASANYIRVINNNARENFTLLVHADGFDADEYPLPANETLELATLDEWAGSFYVYPEECLKSGCDYPVTKVRVDFEVVIFQSFYDFLIVDLNAGFNVAASIKSITTDCGIVACNVDLLAVCEKEDQILNNENVVVACKTSVGNYQAFQELCPDAIVDAGDLGLRVCKSADFEIVFG